MPLSKRIAPPLFWEFKAALDVNVHDVSVHVEDATATAPAELAEFDVNEHDVSVTVDETRSNAPPMFNAVFDANMHDVIVAIDVSMTIAPPQSSPFGD